MMLKDLPFGAVARSRSGNLVMVIGTEDGYDDTMAIMLVDGLRVDGVSVGDIFYEMGDDWERVDD